jgi:hypothetical protein
MEFLQKQQDSKPVDNPVIVFMDQLHLLAGQAGIEVELPEQSNEAAGEVARPFILMLAALAGLD